MNGKQNEIKIIKNPRAPYRWLNRYPLAKQESKETNSYTHTMKKYHYTSCLDI